ncbi:hypothetical protein [Pseudoflavitalea rhizosphaerae]|uniref:hypothetical protein n=1 Tax=Pseudoflavitalea rhizosphaerae TaxID=1884793 RepID=UPI000F8ED7C8|nr:hypothetical protein [Pseudoflavitalea rhizosphaerae]
MNKLSIIALLFVLVLGVSCKKEYYTTEVTEIPNRTIVYTVPPSAWSFNSSDGTYITAIDMPEIDDVVFENDGVVVAALFDGTNYEVLPQVYGGFSYTYFYKPGGLTISIQGSDGSDGFKPTTGIKFKIVLIPSEQ